MLAAARLLVAMMPVGMGDFTGKNIEHTLFLKAANYCCGDASDMQLMNTLREIE